MNVPGVMLLCVVVSQAAVLKSEQLEEWEKFLAAHKITFDSEFEHDTAFKVFIDNLHHVNEHNKQFEAGRKTFKLSLNQYSHMLHSEVFNGLQIPSRRNTAFFKSKTFTASAPESFDWRDLGAVTPVKDQGSCGCCYAFSATGSLEGQHFIKTGKLVRLSEKNLVDCSWLYGNNGCNGGWIDDAFKYIVDNKGIDTEKSYPFQPVNGECNFNSASIGATARGFVNLPVGDEEAHKEAVANVGPISVAINANRDFQFYSGGVMVSEDCSPHTLNHAVLVVGYGNEDGQDYWVVKNSWGTHYGEDGYIKMARNNNNMCGIAQAASYPTL